MNILWLLMLLYTLIHPRFVPYYTQIFPPSGVIIGLILNFAFPPSESLLYDLACPQYECDGVTPSSCADVSSFQIGEDIQLRSAGGDRCKNGIDDENVVIAEVLGKVFKDRNGNYIEQTVRVLLL